MKLIELYTRASWGSEITEKTVLGFKYLWEKKKANLIKVIATVNLVKSESAH